MAELKTNRYMYQCDLLLRSRKELLARLESDEYSEFLNNTVWLIFGPTRTGKSTLLARIKSDLNTPGFCAIIEETEAKSNEPILVEGVEVSSGLVARTTVPNFHVFNNRLLLDLAGFKDLHKDREPVVSILNNSLFSTIRTCKIMIVSKLSVLFDMGAILDMYNSEFKALMTDSNMQLGLKSCVFIFTHCDKHWEKIYERDQVELDEYDERVLQRSVRSLIQDAAAQFTMGDSEIGKFAAHMANKFCLINYQTDDQKTVVDKISALMNKCEDLKADMMRFDVRGVNNALGEDASMVIEGFHREVTTTYSGLKATFSEVSQRLQLDSDLAADLSIKNSDSFKSMNSHLSKISKRRGRIKDLNQKMMDLDGNKKKLELQMTQTVSQMESFIKESSDLVILQFTILRSIHTDKHKIRTELMKTPGCTSNDRIMCLSIDNYTTHKDKIHRCQTMEQFTELKIPNYYDNGNVNDSVVMVNMSTTEYGNRISTNSNVEHVLICATGVKIQEANHVVMVTGYFKDQIDNLSEMIKKNNIDSKNCSLELKELADENKKSYDFIQSGFKECKDRIAGLRDINNDIQLRLKELERVSLNCQEKMNEVSTKQLFNSTKELCELLNKSNVTIKNLDLFNSIQLQFKEMTKDRTEISKLIGAHTIKMEVINKTVESHDLILSELMDDFSSDKSPRDF